MCPQNQLKIWWLGIVETVSNHLFVVFVVSSVRTTIELVGSCCTLVTEMLLEAALNIPEQLCEMLYSMYHDVKLRSCNYHLVVNYIFPDVHTSFGRN